LDACTRQVRIHHIGRKENPFRRELKFEIVLESKFWWVISMIQTGHDEHFDDVCLEEVLVTSIEWRINVVVDTIETNVKIS